MVINVFTNLKWLCICDSSLNRILLICIKENYYRIHSVHAKVHTFVYYHALNNYMHF